MDELTENAGDDILTAPKAGVDDPEAVALHSESMRLLLDTIDELSPWHRNVILLVDVHGYDYAKAADLLELPLGTIKSRLSRARSSLRDRLLAADIVPAHILERNSL